MTTNDTTGEHPELREFLTMWEEIGRLAMDGKLRLRDVRWACETLVMAVVWIRCDESRTRAATILSSSRRRLRTAVADWAEYSSGRSLLEEVRRRSESDVESEAIVSR